MYAAAGEVKTAREINITNLFTLLFHVADNQRRIQYTPERLLKGEYYKNLVMSVNEFNDHGHIVSI